MSLYLIQTLAYKGTDIYKFGCTTGFKARMGGYDKGSEIIMVWHTFDMNCKTIEAKILKVLAKNFQQYRDAGREYFKGCRTSIISVINQQWQNLCLNSQISIDLNPLINNPLINIDESIFDVDDMSYLSLISDRFTFKIIDREKRKGYICIDDSNHWLPITEDLDEDSEHLAGWIENNVDFEQTDIPKNILSDLKTTTGHEYCPDDLNNRLVKAVLNKCYDPNFKITDLAYHQYKLWCDDSGSLKLYIMDLKEKELRPVRRDENYLATGVAGSLIFKESWYNYPLSYIDDIFKRWIDNHHKLIPFMKSIFVEFNPNANIIKCERPGEFKRWVYIYNYISNLLSKLGKPKANYIFRYGDKYDDSRYVICYSKLNESSIRKLTKNKVNIMMITDEDWDISMKEIDIFDLTIEKFLASAILRYIAYWPNIDDRKIDGYDKLIWNEPPTDKFLTRSYRL